MTTCLCPTERRTFSRNRYHKQGQRGVENLWPNRLQASKTTDYAARPAPSPTICPQTLVRSTPISAMLWPPGPGCPRRSGLASWRWSRRHPIDARLLGQMGPVLWPPDVQPDFTPDSAPRIRCVPSLILSHPTPRAPAGSGRPGTRSPTIRSVSDRYDNGCRTPPVTIHVELRLWMVGR
jgi:hypothetical protein